MIKLEKVNLRLSVHAEQIVLTLRTLAIDGKYGHTSLYIGKVFAKTINY